jgi:hypothetical protein
MKNKKKYFFYHLYIKMLEMFGKKSRGKRASAKRSKKSGKRSKKSCAKSNMLWVAAHKSHSAKGKVVKVKGVCRKKHNSKK